MKKIITLSREFGAGAGEIGQKVSTKLNYDYVDKEIILKTASDKNFDTQKLVRFDETPPINFGFTQSLFDLYNAPLNEQFYEAQKNVIKEIAEKRNCVIVGRNSNHILKEYDDSLHIFIYADFDWRVRRLKLEKMPNETLEKIALRVKQVDRARQKFCSYYTSQTFGLAQNYDLCLCTSALGIDTCVNIIVDLAKS